MPCLGDIEVVVLEGNTLSMGDNEEVMVLPEMNNGDICTAGSDEAPSVAGNADTFHLLRRWWLTRRCHFYWRYYTLTLLNWTFVKSP